MPTEQDHVAILRDAYAKWSETKGQSVDHWLDLMVDDVEFRSLADGAEGMDFTCPRCGRKAVTAYFEGLAEGWEMIHYTIDDYIAQGDMVVAVGSCAWRNKATGKAVETPKVDVVRLKDGRIAEFSEFYDTAKVMESFQP